MTIQEYANQNLGTQLDNGWGEYKGECVSLAIRSMKAVYDVPYGTLYCSTTGGARDLYEQFDGKIPTYFDRIENNPNDYNQLPQPGDLIIWGSYMGKYGHVGVVIQANPLKVFQQLGTPVFSKSEIKQYPSYAGVLGWLRPKVINTSQGGKMNKDFIRNMFRYVGGYEPKEKDVDAWAASGSTPEELMNAFIKGNDLAVPGLQASNSKLSAANVKLSVDINQERLNHSQQMANLKEEYEDKLAKATGQVVYTENPETGKKLDAILSIVKSIWGSVTSLHKKIK